MRQLKEIILGKHDILYHGSSPFQDILLMEMAASHERVLILLFLPLVYGDFI
jgi:hypothetical protein